MILPVPGSPGPSPIGLPPENIPDLPAPAPDPTPEPIPDRTPDPTQSYEEQQRIKEQNLVEFLKVSVEDDFQKDKDGKVTYVPLHKRTYRNEGDRYYTYFMKYLEICFKYGLMVVLICTNFIALSLSLNCNADQEFFKRIFSAIFAFFFGFVYIFVNYYTYRVLSQGKICKMNKEKLFPFNA